MTLVEIYKKIERELCNYCKFKQLAYDSNSAAVIRTSSRDQHHLPQVLSDNVSIYAYVELNAITADRHLIDLPDAEKYYSVEVTLAKYTSLGIKNVYYDYNMKVFALIINKKRKEVVSYKGIYPENGPISFNELISYAKEMSLLKKDFLNILNWLKCLNVSLI